MQMNKPRLSPVGRYPGPQPALWTALFTPVPSPPHAPNPRTVPCLTPRGGPMGRQALCKAVIPKRDGLQRGHRVRRASWERDTEWGLGAA